MRVLSSSGYLCMREAHLRGGLGSRYGRITGFYHVTPPADTWYRLPQHRRSSSSPSVSPPPSLFPFLLPLVSLSKGPPKGFEKFFPRDQRREEDKDDKKKAAPGGPGSPDDNRFWTVAVSLTAVLILLSLLDRGVTGYSNEITFQEFLTNFLSHGHVEKIQIVNREYARVFVRPNSPKAGQRYHFVIGSVDTFESKLEHYQAGLGIHPAEYIPIQYVTEVQLAEELRNYIPPIVIFFLFLFWLRRQQASGMGAGGPDRFFKMGRAFPAGTKDMKSKVKFADVAGLKEAKQEIMEFVDFLKSPKKYEHLGARIPKGALLVGPPGTGKTLLAKAVAGEAGVPFFSMSGSDFIEVFVGVGPSRVRDLFAQARKHAPSIVFIDEIDAVGRRRARGGFAGGANDERENTLNQMLVEMDGFTSNTGVVVLAGTNRSDILDPALTRPGRFDRTVTIDKPDLNERQEIFKIHLKPLKLDSNLDVEEVARRLSALTPGFAGADIANICNEAAIFAARRSAKDGVAIEDFERATERVMGGLPKANNLQSQREKKTVAYHEAGHALTGWMLEHADPVLKVSIVPRSSGALGFAQQLPDELPLYSKEALLDKIAVILGGRASEDLFLGKISTGASDDLDKVTKMAYSLVAVFGMNPELGLVSYQQQQEQQMYKPYSEQTAQVIDVEVKKVISDQYERTKGILTQNAEKLRALAELLLAKETITYNDLLECLGQRPFQVKAEYLKYVTASGLAKVEPEEHKTEEGDKAEEVSQTGPPSEPQPA